MVKEVDMICKFDRDGKIRPLKFRVHEEDEPIVVVIDKLMGVTEVNIDLNYKELIYKCRCTWGNVNRDIDITFNNKLNKWYCNI